MENEKRNKSVKEKSISGFRLLDPAMLDCFTGTGHSKAASFTPVTDTAFLGFLLLYLCPEGCLQMCWALRQNTDQLTECFCTETALETVHAGWGEWGRVSGGERKEKPKTNNKSRLFSVGHLILTDNSGLSPHSFSDYKMKLHPGANKHINPQEEQ